MVNTYLWLVVNVGIAQALSETTIQTWVWGEDIPRLLDINRSPMELFELPDDYPDHGFIQLEYNRKEEEMRLILIRRPPSRLFSKTEPFCSTMLPAAIGEFMRHLEIKRVKQIAVHIDADPYIAACKCYMRTFIRMGLSKVGTENIHDINRFCSSKHSTIVATPEDESSWGHAPSGVGLTDIAKLNTACFVFAQNVDEI
jgi:hypothetical protein